MAVSWIAARQLALITVHQLYVAGVRRGAVRRRVANGTLHRLYRGVYLVGHPLPLPGAVELGAVLACGDRAFVSHRSAAALWGLTKSHGVKAQVTVVNRCCGTRDGLRVHHVARLSPADVGQRFGIPITSPARTVIDFAATAGGEEAERAIAEAFALGLVTERRILAAIERTPNRAGVAVVRAILGQPGGPRHTRSGGEGAMLRLVRAARLPVPATNAPLLGFTADCLWPNERLIVEVDSHQFHSHRAAFERDRERDLVHQAAGYEVLRVSGRQLEREPFVVVAAIARALDRRARG